jgi:hypothetical protein
MHLTVAQTPIFQKHAADIWTLEELDVLVDWIAVHAADGDVIPSLAACEKFAGLPVGAASAVARE